MPGNMGRKQALVQLHGCRVLTIANIVLHDGMRRGTETSIFHQPASVAAPARNLFHGMANPANGRAGRKIGAEKHLSAERTNLDQEHYSPSFFCKNLPATALDTVMFLFVARQRFMPLLNNMPCNTGTLQQHDPCTGKAYQRN